METNSLRAYVVTPSAGLALVHSQATELCSNTQAIAALLLLLNVRLGTTRSLPLPQQHQEKQGVEEAVWQQQQQEEAEADEGQGKAGGAWEQGKEKQGVTTSSRRTGIASQAEVGL